MGKISNLTNIFHMGWNHQLVTSTPYVVFGRFFIVFNRQVLKEMTIVKRQLAEKHQEQKAAWGGTSEIRRMAVVTYSSAINWCPIFLGYFIYIYIYIFYFYI